MRLIQRNLSYIDGEFIRHNPDAIASSIIELICEDMKFRDMENDSRYVMLNSKLKDTKRKLKETMPKTRDNKSKHIRSERTSKFAEKYQERIDSIKQSDKKTQTLREQKMKERIKRENNENYLEKEDYAERTLKTEKQKETMKPKKTNTKTQTAKRKLDKWLNNKNNTRKPKH